MSQNSANESLKGICVFPNAYEIKDFTAQSLSLDDWYVYRLTNGRMIKKDGEALKKIIFDFVGDDTFYDGFVKGFIYTNGKFLGKMHYIATSNRPPESLDGTYRSIDRGIELKGIWYSGEERWGFFIQLTDEMPGSQEDKTIQPISKKARNKVEPLNTHKDLLTKTLLEFITKKAEPIKVKNSASKFDHYQHVIALKPKPVDFDNVVMAMGIAYSWMPTMLDIYIDDVRNKKTIVKAIQGLGSIKSLSDFEKNKKNIEKWLTELVNVVNHSIVGASKTAHIFFPKNIPIIDSRVLKTWNDLHKSKFKGNKELKLPLHIPPKTEAMVNAYMLYWHLLLCWAENSNTLDLRMVEEPLYWLGAKRKN
jgi:hypothetical protein